MKRAMLCAVMLLACSLAAQAAEPREQTYYIGANVDARGHVTAAQVDPGVPASIAAALASAVKQWQFVPAARNGLPVPAHTFIYAKLLALPKADGQYSLRIEFLGNGPRIDMASAMPRYPRDAIQAREAGFAVLDATVQPDGSLAGMMVRSQFPDWPLRPSFGHAVLAAAPHWHTVPERVDGQAVATHVRIPVNFTIQDEIFTHKQALILRDAARKETAAAQVEAAQPAIPLPSEQPVALDSPLHLRAVATTASHP